MKSLLPKTGHYLNDDHEQTALGGLFLNNLWLWVCPPQLCRRAQLIELALVCEVSGRTHCPNSQQSVTCVDMDSYQHMVYRPAVWRFWYLASLNVSAVPPLHSGIFCVTSLGLNYIFMGQVDEEGRGKIAPHHFVMVFKTKNQKLLNVLKNKRCWASVAPRISTGLVWSESQLQVEISPQKSSPSQDHHLTIPKTKPNLDAERKTENLHDSFSWEQLKFCNFTVGRMFLNEYFNFVFQ